MSWGLNAFLRYVYTALPFMAIDNIWLGFIERYIPVSILPSIIDKRCPVVISCHSNHPGNTAAALNSGFTSGKPFWNRDMGTKALLNDWSGKWWPYFFKCMVTECSGGYVTILSIWSLDGLGHLNWYTAQEIFFAARENFLLLSRQV